MITLFQDDGSELQLAFDPSKVKRDAKGKFALSAEQKVKLEKKAAEFKEKLQVATKSIFSSKAHVAFQKKILADRMSSETATEQEVLDAVKELDSANQELKAWQTKKKYAVYAIKKSELALAGVTMKDVKDAAAHDAAKISEPSAPKQEFPSDLASLKAVGPLGGSTGATLVRDPMTDVQYVRKTGKGEAQLREEVLADELYRKLGVDVPQSRLYETDSGPVKLSAFEEGAVELGQASPAMRATAELQLRENFAADALLANWDVVGLDADNVLVTTDGRAIRADNGGSLRYRAQGTAKGSAFGNEVGELDTLRDPNINIRTAKVFGSLTDVEVAHQVRALFPKMPGVLDVTREESPELADKLALRYASMGKWADAKLDPTKAGSAVKEKFQEGSTAEWRAGLSSEEAKAVNVWKGNSGVTRGEELAAHYKDDPEFGSKYADYAKGDQAQSRHFNEALDRAPLHEGDVYRGVGMNPDNTSAYALMTTPGGEFDWNCSFSTSTHVNQATKFGYGGVMFKVRTKTAVSLGKDDYEKEVVLRRDRRYRVVETYKPDSTKKVGIHKAALKAHHHLIVHLEEVGVAKNKKKG